jgi:serine/threonine protein kinase/tetratricopeptide (TPR) repeat protein
VVEGGAPADPLLGRTLNGKYRVESEIGQGAMGTVYLGEHIGLRKKVALKVLHSDMQVSDESLQRFQREGMAAGRFNHPHAIQIFDFDRSDAERGGARVFYLAMEYVEGVNLTLFLKQRGRLPVDLAVKLARQVLSCLAEAHRHGIVHRDLKPDNIMVSEGSRGEMRVKVLDFGLSKLVDRRLNSSFVTQPGRLLGTPLYMAPEQVAGDDADERSDVYAAGLILYEMLAGERPFREKDATQLFLTRPTAEAPSLRANVPDIAVPDQLETLLLRALERDRTKRYQTAEEMLNALDEVPMIVDSISASWNARTTRHVASSSPPARTSTTQPAPGAGEAAPRAPRSRERRVRFAVMIVLAIIAFRGVQMWNEGRGGAGSRPARARLLDPSDRSEQETRYLAMLDEARVKLLGNDIQAALTAVNQAFVLASGDPEAFFVRAEIYRARGDLDTAMADFRAAAQGDPRFAEPLLGMGWIDLERGNLGPAEESFTSAGEIAPENAGVLAARGALAWKRGEREQARPLLEEAAKKDPSCAPAHLYLGRQRLDQGEADGAIEALVAAKRGDASSSRALLWLCEAYLAKGSLDAADAQLEEALRLEPANAEVRVQRGALMLERGRGSEALEFLTESTERAPQEGRLWILRGIAAHESGDVAGAIDSLRRGFEQGARDPDARCLLGALYQRRGDLAEAIAQYETVLREEGDYPQANLELALALAEQGKYLEARERLERVLAYDEENLAAHLLLGQLYRNVLDDEEQALAHLERFLALGGEDPRLAGWLDDLR